MMDKEEVESHHPVVVIVVVVHITVVALLQTHFNGRDRVRMMPTMVVFHTSNSSSNSSRTLMDTVNRTHHVEDYEEEEDVTRMLAESFEDVVVLLDEVELEEMEDGAIWDNNSLKVEQEELEVDHFHSRSQPKHEEVDEMDEHQLGVVEEEGRSRHEVPITRDDHALEFIPMTNTNPGMSL